MAASVRNYGRISTRFWMSPDVCKLSRDAKLLAAYLLTGPHTNMIGCFRLPLAYVANDLDFSSEFAKVAIAELEGVNFCKYDSAYSWILLPKFLKFNTI